MSQVIINRAVDGFYCCAFLHNICISNMKLFELTGKKEIKRRLWLQIFPQIAFCKGGPIRYLI